jgi:hypothetical protein
MAQVLGVGQGDQACGETGDGRMLEPTRSWAGPDRVFQPKVLAGQQVLVTAGPTYEAIDPVRGITNLSSGKMGFAIARAAREAGAEVTLVAGPVSLPTPRGVTRIDVRPRADMLAAVLASADSADGFHCHRGGRRLARGHGGRPEDQEGRLRRTPRCSSSRTRTSWPRWRSRHARADLRAASCTASALPPKARTCWPTPGQARCARACRCWWATSARPPSAGRQCAAAGGRRRREEVPRASKLELARELVIAQMRRAGCRN